MTLLPERIRKPIIFYESHDILIFSPGRISYRRDISLSSRHFKESVAYILNILSPSKCRSPPSSLEILPFERVPPTSFPLNFFCRKCHSRISEFSLDGNRMKGRWISCLFTWTVHSSLVDEMNVSWQLVTTMFSRWQCRTLIFDNIDILTRNCENISIPHVDMKRCQLLRIRVQVTHCEKSIPFGWND